MNPLKTCRLFIVIVMLISLSLPVTSAKPSPYSPLINGTGIYLSPDQTWDFYQGYSFRLMSVSNDGESVWVQLMLNGSVLKTGVMRKDDVFYYNLTNTTVVFNLRLSGIYSGEQKEIVTFSPVYQYYVPMLPDPTPTPVRPADIPDITSTRTEDNGLPGFRASMAAILIYGCIIFMHRHR